MSKPKYKVGDRKRFRTFSGLMVSCEILKVKKLFWWNIYLCKYGTNHRSLGVYLYTATNAKWLREGRLI